MCDLASQTSRPARVLRRSASRGSRRWGHEGLEGGGAGHAAPTALGADARLAGAGCGLAAVLGPPRPTGKRVKQGARRGLVLLPAASCP